MGLVSGVGGSDRRNCRFESSKVRTAKSVRKSCTFRSKCRVAISGQAAQNPYPGGRETRQWCAQFALYGEAGSAGQEMLHIEEVQSRSRLLSLGD
jgi:hypothetical protein